MAYGAPDTRRGGAGPSLVMTGVAPFEVEIDTLGCIYQLHAHSHFAEFKYRILSALSQCLFVRNILIYANIWLLLAFFC